MNMEPVVVLAGKGHKRQLSITSSDYSQCIVCQTTADDQGPLYNLTKKGLTTFKKAVEIRKDGVYSRVWDDLQNEDQFLSKKPLCHEKCRSSYTLKRTLDNLVSAKLLRAEQGETSCEQKCRRSSTDYKAVCFLCERKRDSKGDRELTLVTTVNRQNSIHSKAKELRDESVLLKIQGHGDNCLDLIANDFRYHLRCMNNFMNRRCKVSEQTCDSTNSREHDEVFQLLVSEISSGLFNKQVYHLGQLTNRFTELLTQQGAANKRPYRSDRLKRRLSKHYESDIQYITLKHRDTFVCQSSLTVKEFCDEVVSLQSKLDDCELDEEEEEEVLLPNVSNSSYHVAKHLRAEVKTFRKVGGAILENEELEISYEGAASQVPVVLYNHLAWLLTERDEYREDGKIQLSKDDDEKVLSLAQDIVGFLTRQQLPKHIGVALHILKETRSKNLVTMINKFGHCISYPTAQRFITTAANDVSEREERDGLFIPTNITQGHFTQYALDNLNFHSETEDGGSFDATTNIIYQYTPEGGKGEKVAGTVPVKKTRKLTISEPDKFVPVSSKLTLKDRRQARTLCDIKLPHNNKGEVCSLADENIVWFLLRMYPTHLMASEKDRDTGILTWSRFFEFSSGQYTEKTMIGYGPLLPENPTNADVVQTSLDYFISLNLKMGQASTVVTCDQAIYDIVKGLVRKDMERYQNVIVRLGGFHIAQNFLGAIGFLMKESGIEDILVSSNICGRGTANKVMAGKDYYKMVRYHSGLSEAFFMLKWEAFEKWLVLEQKEETLSLLSSLLENLRNAFNKLENDEFTRLKEEVITYLESMESLWGDFEKELGVTAHLWSMYIDMVLILRRYILAERAGLWQQHLQEVENMVPYIIASGHTKYMSSLPIYLSDMHNLPETAPDVHKEFTAGRFTVHQTAGNFNGVWTDLALEQTYNKESKTKLFKGITQSESAREKYIKALPFMTSVSESVKQMAHMTSPQPDHHEKLRKDDLNIVLHIKSTIEEKMQNPFNLSLVTDKLMNISSGQILSSTTLKDAKRLGMEAMEATTMKNAEKIIQPKIETFAMHMKKSKKKKDTVKEVIREENTVTRALCFAQDLSDEARTEAFSYEWLEYPPSLFEPEKNAFIMRKGCKSIYLSALQAEVVSSWEPFKELPPSTSDAIYVIDAMAFIQRFNTLGSSTFGQLQEKYKDKLLNMKPLQCNEVHFVGDRYDFGLQSLKGDERQRRESNTDSPEYVPADSMKIPDWKKFMSNPCNKANLLSYLASRWSQKSFWPVGFCLVLGIHSQATRVTQTEHTNVDELYCPNHEEADTRIFAHIANCEDKSRVIIQATDTDIIVLSLYHFPRLSNVVELWVEKDDLFLPIHDLVNELAKAIREDVLALTDTLLISYVLSGCDSVSYPFKRGKKRTLKVALQHVGKQPALSNYTRYESGSTVHDQAITEARRFFCDLYGKPGYSSLDKLRAHLFASSRVDLRSLPPTEDAFHYHVLRSLNQISVYKQAFLSNPVLLQPEEYGRRVDGDRLIPIMKSKPSKPSAAKLKFCKCKRKSSCLKNCPCAKVGVPCIIACACSGDKEKCGRLLSDDSDDE